MPAFKKIEPADLKHRVSFLQEGPIPDGYGGTTLGLVQVLSTWCAIEPQSTGLSYNDLLNVVAGSVQLERDIVLKIRARNGFTPAKDMQFDVEGKRYMVTSFQDIDEPVRYVRIIGKTVE
jgi:SPP1 family predicted phage head-tail adaptor